jgi:hypothetical protein
MSWHRQLGLGQYRHFKSIQRLSWWWMAAAVALPFGIHQVVQRWAQPISAAACSPEGIHSGLVGLLAPLTPAAPLMSFVIARSVLRYVCPKKNDVSVPNQSNKSGTNNQLEEKTMKRIVLSRSPQLLPSSRCPWPAAEPPAATKETNH